MAEQPARRSIPITREDGTTFTVVIDAAVPEDKIPIILQRHLEIIGELKDSPDPRR